MGEKEKERGGSQWLVARVHAYPLFYIPILTPE